MKYYDMNLSTTDIVCEEVWVKDGRIDISRDQDLKFVAVVTAEGNDNIAPGSGQGLWHKDRPWHPRYPMTATIFHCTTTRRKPLWRQRSWRAQAAVCAP